MLGAVGRLLAITFVVLILAVFAVVFMRSMGLKQEFQAPPHAWFADKEWNILAPTLPEICADSPAASPENWILRLPIQKSRSGTWEIPCTPQPLPLQNYLARSKQKKILLKLEAGDITDLDKLVDICTSFEASGKSFAVWAPAQKVARAMRKTAPQWLFAADQASLLRLHMFESLWLETSPEFWPDFVIASINAKDGSRLSEREVVELHRRQKRILWDESSGEKPPFAVDGVMTARGPAELLK